MRFFFGATSSMSVVGTSRKGDRSLAKCPSQQEQKNDSSNCKIHSPVHFLKGKGKVGTCAQNWGITSLFSKRLTNSFQRGDDSQLANTAEPFNAAKKSSTEKWKTSGTKVVSEDKLQINWPRNIFCQ